jgi:two-component system OmpR family response regulator
MDLSPATVCFRRFQSGDLKSSVTKQLPETTGQARSGPYNRPMGTRATESGDAPVQVVLVDDDADIRQLVGSYLTEHGLVVHALADGSRLDKVLDAHLIDIVLLDLMLPGESGLSLCQELRRTRNLPVIMLTALAEESDRVLGLEMGADDYLTKPFSNRELLARIRAVLRRTETRPAVHEPDAHQCYAFDGWRMFPNRRELTNPEGVLVSLTGGEFDLLIAFVSRPQQVLSREVLLEATKGKNARGFDRSIDVQLSRLRRKLAGSDLIRTVRGGGYLFASDVQVAPADE